VPSLVEVAEISPGVDRSTVLDPNEIVSFVPMASVSEVTGSVTSEEGRPLSEVLKGFTAFHDRDVLVAKITPCFENGKIAHARIQKRLGFGSTEFHVIRAHADKLHDRYLFHFLRQPRIREAGERRMTGSAGQRRVPRAFLEELDVPLPPLPEQRRIAAVLDKADALRAKRREAIAKLDQLLQSVFLEMFGDPVTNPKAEVMQLSSLCDRITDGTHQSPTWADDGVPFLFQSNVKPGEISYDTKRCISLQDYAALTARCPIEFGDVLYTIVGSYGNAAMVRTHEPFCFQRHIAHLNRPGFRGGPLV
jgi:type I restriction enzyme, S subunit